MNALFYITAYHFRLNEKWRFLVSTPDGPHDRFEVVLELMIKEYPELSRWTGSYVCLTQDDVFKEIYS